MTTARLTHLPNKIPSVFILFPQWNATYNVNDTFGHGLCLLSLTNTHWANELFGHRIRKGDERVKEIVPSFKESMGCSDSSGSGVKKDCSISGQINVSDGTAHETESKSKV